MKALERCSNERIDREMRNIVDTVEDRIQCAILTAIDNIVAPKIELAIRSINASSGRYVTNVIANSERGEHTEIKTPFENASGNSNTLHVSNVIDETRNNISDGVIELWVPETRFDRQAHTHHNTVKGRYFFEYRYLCAANIRACESFSRIIFLYHFFHLEHGTFCLTRFFSNFDHKIRFLLHKIIQSTVSGIWLLSLTSYLYGLKSARFAQRLFPF